MPGESSSRKKRSQEGGYPEYLVPDQSQALYYGNYAGSTGVVDRQDVNLETIGVIINFFISVSVMCQLFVSSVLTVSQQCLRSVSAVLQWFRYLSNVKVVHQILSQ